MMSRAVSVVIGMFIFGGCAGLMTGGDGVATDRLQEVTANELDMNANDLIISNKRVVELQTYYDVSTKKGEKFHCSIEGGGALYLGMIGTPQCAKKGEKLPEAYNPETLTQKQSTKKGK